MSPNPDSKLIDEKQIAARDQTECLIQNLERFYRNLSDKFEKPNSKMQPKTTKAILLE